MSQPAEKVQQTFRALVSRGEVVIRLQGVLFSGDHVPGRIGEIRAGHVARLTRIVNFLNAPHSIVDISMHLFREVGGYDTLLAVEEAGAHVEYLNQLGLARITNIEQSENRKGSTTFLYQRVVDPLMEKI